MRRILGMAAVGAVAVASCGCSKVAGAIFSRGSRAPLEVTKGTVAQPARRLPSSFAASARLPRPRAVAAPAVGARGSDDCARVLDFDSASSAAAVSRAERGDLANQAAAIVAEALGSVGEGQIVELGRGALNSALDEALTDASQRRRGWSYDAERRDLVISIANGDDPPVRARVNAHALAKPYLDTYRR